MASNLLFGRRCKSPLSDQRAPPLKRSRRPCRSSVDRSALIIIDMQRDFLEPGGFGAALGNDVSRLQAAVAPCRDVLAAVRRAGMLVIHTREGHRPDLSDAPPHKVERGDPALADRRARPDGPHFGARGARPRHHSGAVSCHGRAGHRQAGQGRVLSDRSRTDAPQPRIDTLLVCGVTTEVCVNTTVREANDRGFRCIVLSDCCASYFQEFHAAGLAMIKAQGGIFGSVSNSAALLNSLELINFTSSGGMTCRQSARA